MTNLRKVSYALALILLSTLWWKLHRSNTRRDLAITAQTLGPADSAKIIVNPRTHSIVTVTREGTKATFLPYGGASVEIGKSGTVKINTRSWGTEVRPFAGGAFGVDIRLRAAVGLDVFYLYRWEFGGGLLGSNDVRDTRLFMHVSYNVFDNWYLAIGADNRGTAHLMAGLKF